MRCTHGYETGHRLETEGKISVLDLLPAFLLAPAGTLTTEMRNSIQKAKREIKPRVSVCLRIPLNLREML